MKDFNHIHQTLTENGYPESHNSEWFIEIEEYDGCRVVSHWYDCFTEDRAKRAVRSLLNKTDVYTVTVYSPRCNPTSYHGKFTSSSEYDWNWYISRIHAM